MTQQNNTVSLLLQDINGQQQMIKVVQGTTSKSLNPMVKTTIGGQTIKGIFKATSSQEAGQSLLTTNQVLKTIGVTGKLGPRFVHLQPATQGTQKFMEGQTLQKIQLSPSQMAASGLKLITTSQQQKSPSPQQSQPVSPNINKTYISPILDHTGARKRHTVDSEYNPPEYSKRRRSDKVGKGLRHFSMKVCEKVRKKGTTSYNEVADELVSEFTNPAHMANSAAEQYDQKNIRRRVYDALNVLMAMNIISKEKKEIRWLGLPTNSLQEYIQLEKEKQKRMNSIKQKEQQLRDLIYQQISFKNLVERNKEHQRMYGVPSTNSTIPLPFIIVNTDKKTQVECSISNDKMEYCFSFDNTFEINDDIEVLKKAGMLMGLDKGEISEENIKKAKSMLPKSLGSYVEKLAAQPDLGDNYIDSAGPSGSPGAVEYVETCLGEGEASRQSSFSDPLSPNILDFSDDEPDSEDLSSDIDIN